MPPPCNSSERRSPSSFCADDADTWDDNASSISRPEDKAVDRICAGSTTAFVEPTEPVELEATELTPVWIADECVRVENEAALNGRCRAGSSFDAALSLAEAAAVTWGAVLIEVKIPDADIPDDDWKFAVDLETNDAELEAEV
jgi:hypothetical protein